MQYYDKKANLICFDRSDLRALFEAPSRMKLVEEIRKSGLTPKELMSDPVKMQFLVDGIKVVQTKEDVEFFSALYIYHHFYSKDSQICFKLRGSIDPRKESIDTINKLKQKIKECDITDFLFRSEDGYRSFQLKSYKGKTSVEELFNFINSKLKHYGYSLGEVNLLITMQSRGVFVGSFFKIYIKG